MTRQEACQCVGKGWHDLISLAYELILPETEMLDVKEKFGGLRFECFALPVNILMQIENIEEKSLTICERCGNPGTPRENKAGWVKTLCNRCAT